MEISKKKTITVFNTDALVPGGHYHFTVTENTCPNPNSISCPIPNSISFDAIIASVDEEILDILVYIDFDADENLDAKLRRLFDEIRDIGVPCIYYYRIYPDMLDGTYKDTVGPLDVQIKLMS